jgi:hypothetical protein
MYSFKNAIRGFAIAAVPMAALALTATPAQATLPTVVFSCDASLTTPDATACAGYYDGNLLNGSPTDIQNQKDALALLGFIWNGDWDALANSTSPDLVLVNGVDGLSGPGSNRLDFGTMLYGITYIGSHFGNVAGDAGNVSVFWKFDLGSAGASYITLDNTQGWSNAALYGTDPGGVPEPGTWALMFLGFGLTGFAIRRSRAKTSLLTQLA